jgi:hypothetical protein
VRRFMAGILAEGEVDAGRVDGLGALARHRVIERNGCSPFKRN